MRYWAMVGDDVDCYALIDEYGITQGYALELERGLWRWRTEAHEGTEATRNDAMDAAEDSLDPKRDLHNGR